MEEQTNKTLIIHISRQIELNKPKAMLKQIFLKRKELATVVTWRERWPEAAGEDCGGGCSDHVRRSEVEV